MKITQAGEYGLQGLMYLGRQKADRLVMLDEICQAERIPKGFLAKIFQGLNKAGFLRSRQGSRGGFSLARTPQEVSVLEVLETIEGKIAFQRPPQDLEDCARRDACTLCAVLKETQDLVRDTFGKVTLADLMQPKEKALRKMRGLRRKNNAPLKSPSLLSTTGM